MNILIKLMSIVSLVIAPTLKDIFQGSETSKIHDHKATHVVMAKPVKTPVAVARN